MSLEREIRKIMAGSVQENFVKNPDCDICGDGSPCTCGESQEVEEDIRDLPKDKQRALQHADKTAKPKSQVSLAPTPGIKTEKLTPAQRDMRDAGRGKDSGAKSYVKHQAGSDNPHKKGRMHKGDNQSHDDQRHVRKGEDDFKKPSHDDLANKPSTAKRLDMKKKKDAFDKARAQSQSSSGRDNMGGVGVREANLDEAFEAFFAEGLRVFFVSGSNAEGNVHAKNEKEALAKAKKKGIKGKITIRDKGEYKGQPKFVESVNEGYEGEVKKVLDKKGIDAYFKNGKLMVSKRDKPTVMKILKGQDFDMPTIQVEEIQMKTNRFGLSVSLVDAVANVLAGKRPVDEMKMKKDDEDEKKKAKKAPVTDKDDDGDGMDPVGQEDGDIDNDGDKDDSDKFLAKKRKAIGKAMKKDGGGKEPVDTKPKMDEAKIDERLKLGDPKRDSREIARTGKRVNPSNVGNFNTKPVTTTSSGTGKPFHKKYTTTTTDDSGDTKLQKSGGTDKIGGGQSRAQRHGKKDRMNKGGGEKDRFDMGEPSRGGDNPNAKPKVDMKAKPKGKLPEAKIDERLKLGDPKRDSRELARTGSRVPPSRLSGPSKNDVSLTKTGSVAGVGAAQSNAQKKGVPHRHYGGEPEKVRTDDGGASRRFRMSPKDRTGTANLSKDKLANRKLPEDMSDGQMKRREEIVKELKKKSADFESRYGDKADAVIYATATKMAMKGK